MLGDKRQDWRLVWGRQQKGLVRQSKYLGFHHQSYEIHGRDRVMGVTGSDFHSSKPTQPGGKVSLEAS